MIDDKILQQIIDTWGADIQIEIIIEECAELIQALQKLKRNHKTEEERKQAFFNVADEIADVKIMMAQADLIFDKDLINERVNFKMDRVTKKLKKIENKI